MKVEISRVATEVPTVLLSIAGGTYYPNNHNKSLTHSELLELRNAIDTYLSNLPKPHPHAELMALYAKDAAETDKPWERWLTKRVDKPEWGTISFHPLWAENYAYRRKEGV